jgi:hypothetical protein
MPDKDQQLKELHAAVARKAEAADANVNPERSGPGPDVPPPPDAPAGTTDAGDPHHKSERKGKVTAENWNQ